MASDSLTEGRAAPRPLLSRRKLGAQERQDDVDAFISDVRPICNVSHCQDRRRHGLFGLQNEAQLVQSPEQGPGRALYHGRFRLASFLGRSVGRALPR